MARKNQTREEDLAAEGYEKFHGKESEKVVTDRIMWPPPDELEWEFGPWPKLPKWVSALGELLWFSYEKELENGELQEEEIYEFNKPYPLLCSDFQSKCEGEESLFVIGGNYKLHQEDDLICGNLIRVSYLSVKSFDDFTPTEYVHRLDADWPIAAQSKDRRQLYIFRGESEFSIERNGNVSAGIAG
jgi:hypothetical protein